MNKKKQKTEEAHINIAEPPASYKKCRVQSKLKVSMQNSNARWRAGPFEVDRWTQTHELNIKGSTKNVGFSELRRMQRWNKSVSLPSGRRDSSRPCCLQTDTNSEPDTRQRASLKKVFTLSKEKLPPDAKRSEMYADWS